MDKISAGIFQKVCLTFITSDLRMKKPRYISYEKEDGFFTSTYNIANHVIAVVERTYSDMVRELRNEFFEAWQYYALEDDNNLSEGAVKVKKWLLDNIHSFNR